MGAYRLRNLASSFVQQRGSRILPQPRPREAAASRVRDQRACDSVVFSASTSQVGPYDCAEILHAFTLRVSEEVPDDFCADPLHAQAERLMPFSPSLQSAVAFEALEDGSPSPPRTFAAPSCSSFSRRAACLPPP